MSTLINIVLYAAIGITMYAAFHTSFILTIALLAALVAIVEH